MTVVEAEVGVAAGIGAGVVSGAGDVDSSSGVGTLELELVLSEVAYGVAIACFGGVRLVDELPYGSEWLALGGKRVT